MNSFLKETVLRSPTAIPKGSRLSKIMALRTTIKGLLCDNIHFPSLCYFESNQLKCQFICCFVYLNFPWFLTYFVWIVTIVGLHWIHSLLIIEKDFDKPTEETKSFPLCPFHSILVFEEFKLAEKAEEFVNRNVNKCSFISMDRFATYFLGNPCEHHCCYDFQLFLWETELITLL